MNRLGCFGKFGNVYCRLFGNGDTVIDGNIRFQVNTVPELGSIASIHLDEILSIWKGFGHNTSGSPFLCRVPCAILNENMLARG